MKGMPQEWQSGEAIRRSLEKQPVQKLPSAATAPLQEGQRGGKTTFSARLAKAEILVIGAHPY